MAKSHRRRRIRAAYRPGHFGPALPYRYLKRPCRPAGWPARLRRLAGRAKKELPLS